MHGTFKHVKIFSFLMACWVWWK